VTDKEEKKISLDELPDEGRETARAASPIPAKKVSKEEDPRLEKLKKLDPVSKVEMMIQKWEFDQPIKSYTWLGYILFLIALQVSPFHQAYLGELHQMSKTSATMSEIWIENTGIIHLLLKYPLILLILLPFVYRSPKASDYIFRISFDGIDTVRRVLPNGSKEILTRTFIKWNELSRIEKGRVDGKEILRLYSVDGHIGDLIWYIDSTKKKAIALLLKGLIVPKHPLRLFLANEKDSN
jgi:hypothetical protein